ncbi:MAG: contractile injection system protein, VgrG/Pvc8 family [Acidobacteria bacterium]|nr:contractile injection system protein, VgrG/Pvc8 family [Acidobacteriota bacterium]
MTPDLRVSANGRDITGVVRDRFVSVSVTDVVDEQADRFELTLDDRAPGIAVPPTGARLDVELGFLERGTAPMGSYTVTEVEKSGPPQTLTLRAQAADLLGELKAPRTRSWSLMTIGDVVGTIAGRHGLEPRIDPALSGVALPHIDQKDESDLNLLRRLASYQLDVVAKVSAGRLVFLRRQVLANELAAAATRIERTEGLDYRVLRADREMYGAVVAKWREFTAGELREVRAGDGSPVFELPETFPDYASAHNAAQTKLRALKRGTHTGELTLSPGRLGLAADAPVQLEGWCAGVDGVWVVKSARHELSEDGYRTSVDVEAVTEPWERAAWEPPAADPFAGAKASLGRAAAGGVPGGGGVPGRGGGGGRGGTPAPDMAHVVERVAALRPDALRNAEYTLDFTREVVAALRELDPRWGFHRDPNGTLSTGLVAYFRGGGDPVEGSSDIAVRALTQGVAPDLFPSWGDVTAFYPGTWALPASERPARDGEPKPTTPEEESG